MRTSDSLGLWTTGAYKYDGSGNVWKTGSGLYLYDSLSRVVSGKVYPGAMGTGTPSTQAYGYDNYGNLTSTTTNGTLVNTPAATATNCLTAGTYDASGNLTAWSGNTYEYDAFDQMSRHVSSGEDWRYMYTADDERFWAFRVGGGGSVWTLRGLGGEALREYSAHLGWTNYRDNIYRGGTLLATVASAAAGGTTKHLHTDHLGTPRLITDAAGNPATAQFHAYYPYGEELAATYTSSYTDRMRFTGHERDLVNLGGQGDDLDYMHARHYGVVTGRFLSVDRALGFSQSPQSWNRYAYGLSNPARNIDPDGRFTQDTLLGYMNAFVSDFTFGLGRMESESPDFQEGQRLGDEAAQKAGAALAGIGLTTAGLGLVAELPTLGGSTVAVAGGLATAGYGTAVAGIATHQLMKRTPHDEERYQQARAGDKHREVGDANRVVREGREFVDTKTGNRIFVNGDRVVVVNVKDGSTTRFVNKRSNTQKRISSGRWIHVTK